MNRSYLETLVGLLVLLVAVMFAYKAYQGAGLEKDADDDQYLLNVTFDRVDGLNIGGDVRVSGLNVGTVKSAAIDPSTYQAKVQLSVDNSIKLPDDSSAEIVSAGLLGDKYIALVPGGSETFLKKGDKIRFSQPSISLEALIGKFMFGSSDKKDDQKDDESEKETF